MKNLKSHFKFGKQERSGIFYLLLLVVLLQVGYVLYVSSSAVTEDFFEVDVVLQARINELKQKALRGTSVKIYPYNPNFITDYKGYALGMSASEIGRLHAYRKENKYVNSAKEFQKITLVSDSLLRRISPYFKFAEWTQNRKKEISNSGVKVKKTSKFNIGVEVIDLNVVTATELRIVNGVGEKLSARIVKFRDRLGGFLVNEQLYDVYGLEPAVVSRVLERFKVLKTPSVKRININTATADELSKLVYLQKSVCYGIIDYRNLNGTIHSFEELLKIENFPVAKIDRITLYLSLKK